MKAAEAMAVVQWCRLWTRVPESLWRHVFRMGCGATSYAHFVGCRMIPSSRCRWEREIVEGDSYNLFLASGACRVARVVCRVALEADVHHRCLHVQHEYIF